MNNITYNPIKGVFVLNPTDTVKWDTKKNIRDLIQWKEESQRGDKEIGFKNLTLALTTRCNLRCPYCWQSHGKDKSKDMSKVTIDYWLDFFLDEEKNNPNKVLYYGGEPTLRMDLIQYASEKIKQLTKARNIKMVQQHIFTNGMLLTEQNLGILKEAGVFIVLSLDGDPTITQSTRGLSEEIYRDTILKAADSMHRYGLEFGVACTIGDIHFDVEKTARYLIDNLRPSSIEFNLRHDREMVRKYENETDFSYDSFFKAWDIALDAGVKVIDLAKRAKAFIAHEPLINSSSGSKNKLSVMCNGNVSTYNGAISFPELQIDPMNNDWMNLFRANWNRNITKNHQKCQNCEALYMCGQGSAFSSFIQYNDMSKIPAYHCYLCETELEYFKYRLEKSVKTDEKDHEITADELREVFLL